MPKQTFVDYSQNTPITASWLNGVNNFIYGNSSQAGGLTSPAAWVRFTVVGTVVTVQQSYNVGSVVRTGVGLYTINFAQVLPQATNCYQVSQNTLGMTAANAESTSSVSVEFANTSGVLTDPGTASVTVFGAYAPQY